MIGFEKVVKDDVDKVKNQKDNLLMNLIKNDVMKYKIKVNHGNSII